MRHVVLAEAVLFFRELVGTSEVVVPLVNILLRVLGKVPWQYALWHAATEPLVSGVGRGSRRFGSGGWSLNHS